MSKIKVPAGFRQKFIEALRSGKYPKTEGAMFRPGMSKNMHGETVYGAYCALGVGCKILGATDQEIEGQSTPWSLEYSIQQRLGVTCSGIKEVRHIMSMNDNGADFDAIATWLEKETEATL